MSEERRQNSRRTEDHTCLHEGEIAVLNEFMKDTKEFSKQLRSIFVQNFVQIVISVGMVGGFIWMILKK